MAMLLQWNQATDKRYESGVDRVVLFPRETDGSYPAGYAWEGVISIDEKPGGAEPTELWANNVMYAVLRSAQTFEGTIEAYTAPIQFMACDGYAEADTDLGVWLAQQDRQPFGLAYRTWVGSDAAGQQASYKIHVVYGCSVQPSEQTRSTINDSPEAASLSWDFKSTPAPVTGFNPTSKIVLDSASLSVAGLAAVEAALYGVADPETAAYLPLPDALIALAETV